MSVPSIIICVVLGLSFFFAVQRILKKGTCGGKCGDCACECSYKDDKNTDDKNTDDNK